MAVTIKIACTPFIKAVMDNEFSETYISFKHNDWWADMVYMNFRKPRVGEVMPKIEPGQNFIAFNLPDRMAKEGKIYLPERFRKSLLSAIEKYGYSEIGKKIEKYVATDKYLLKDCILMSLAAYGLDDDENQYKKYERAYHRKRSKYAIK